MGFVTWLSKPRRWHGYCDASFLARGLFQRVPSSIIGSNKMKHQIHFGTVAADREITQTRIFIGDLYRIVRLLDADIAAEEERAGVVDLTRPEYPIVARELRARRDNILQSIGELRQRL
jgi:hypothetical protein